MLARVLIQTTLWLGAIGALLLWTSGDWLWPQAWIFIAEMAGSSFAVCIWLVRHDPALLAQRATSPFQRDQPVWDRAFLCLILLTFFAWLALIAFDARHWTRSLVPMWAQGLGGLSIATCMILVWQTFRWNSFAVPQVRFQGERGHTVVTEGPYRFVRHPMYAGALFFFFGTPLLLGSLWGLAAVPLLALAMGGRAIGEERMLRRELVGYDAYARRVRWRLVPGIW